MQTTHKRTNVLLASAIALAFGVGAHAADDAKRAPGTVTAQSSSATAKMGDAKTSKADIRASKLIGREVVNAQGEDLGEIKDLVVDTTNGKVHYAVISFGGVLGLGDKLFAYPLDRFRPSAKEADKLVLNVDREKLKDAPGFGGKDWPDFNDAKYRSGVDRYHGSRAATGDLRFARASEILDGDVKDRSNNDIGDIEDMVVNLGNGQVRYVVLEFDREWNPDDKLVAMPMKALRSEDRDGSDLVYQADRERLRSAPSFEKDRWPAMSDQRFRADVDRYQQTWVNNPASRPPIPERGIAAQPRPDSGSAPARSNDTASPARQ